MGLNLVSRTEYKEYTGINNPNTDNEIDLLIAKVSQLVKTYCRQSFIDYYDDPKSELSNGGNSFIYLKEHPIVNIISVEFSGDFGRTYTELTEYEGWAYEPHNFGIRSTSSIFPERSNGYKITYTSGYEEVPGDLKLAVMDLITYYRKNDGAVHSPKAPGTNSVQIEYISTTTLPAHIRRVLDQYVADYT